MQQQRIIVPTCLLLWKRKRLLSSKVLSQPKLFFDVVIEVFFYINDFFKIIGLRYLNLNLFLNEHVLNIFCLRNSN